MLSFVDDGLIIAQNKSIITSNSQLFCSYNVLLKLLVDFGLVIEHRKTEVFHFNRLYKVFNPLPLNFFYQLAVLFYVLGILGNT